MTIFLNFKKSNTKVRILKSRKLDFFRINPMSVLRVGKKKLIRKGVLSKHEPKPVDNPNHFITHSFITYWSKSRFTDGDIHVGFTASIKTISKRANKRNRARRRLRALINENIREYRVRGYDFVFTARLAVLETSFADLKQELKRTLKHAEYQIRQEKKSARQNDIAEN